MKSPDRGSPPLVDWEELLKVIAALHRGGMSVLLALEHHAYYGSGPSKRLAEQWLIQRQISGDPILAMRDLAAKTKGNTDRFAAEMVTICLEYPASDHGTVLAAAVAQVQTQRLEVRRTPRAGALAACALLIPGAVEGLRALMAVVEV